MHLKRPLSTGSLEEFTHGEVNWNRSFALLNRCGWLPELRRRRLVHPDEACCSPGSGQNLFDRPLFSSSSTT